jgi:DNA-directed DNA polymerase III PolC
MATSFVPLRLRSRESRLLGTIPPGDLPRHLKDAGFGAAALMDIANLYGAIQFYEECRKNDIKPIIGAEVACPKTGMRAGLIALTRDGYGNLCRIVSDVNLGEEIPLTESMAASPDGIAALSSDPEYALKLADILATDRVRLEVTPNRQSASQIRSCLERARSAGLKAVVTWEVLFLDASEESTSRVLSSIREGTLFSQTRIPASHASFEASWGIAAIEQRHPELLTETVRVADMVDLKLEIGKPHFPRAGPTPEASFACLRELSEAALVARYNGNRQRALRRVQAELNVIRRLGLADYFLVVREITEFAKSKSISITGRGSGAGSLVAYLLDITQVDPIAQGLVFERFLNEHRPDYPDLDIDISWKRRDDVIDYVYKRYGTSKVAMISTHACFELRSAAREAAKAFGLSPYEAQSLASRLPFHSREGDESRIEKVLEAVRPELSTERRKQIARAAGSIVGFPHHTSIHCGGIVISDRPITYYTPLEMAAKGIQVTQFDMHAIEKIGLIKIDLLGNRALSVIEEATSDIETNHAIKITICPHDAKTGDLLVHGNTLSCFQLESPAMRNLLAMLKARNQDDATLALALVRPGPSAGGMKERFIRRRFTKDSASRNGERGTSYDLPVYQEDIMRMISRATGMTLAEADILRRELTDGDRGEREIERKFMFLAESIGMGREHALDAWHHVRRFAAYSFCKAHAASYGVLAYASAYLKANFPLEFYAACLRNHAGMYPTWAHVNEARRLGIRVLLPSVNESGEDFAIERKAIRTGLRSIKHLSEKTLERMLKERREAPFRSLSDFLARVAANKDEVAALVTCGAMDGIIDDRCGALAGYMAFRGDTAILGQPRLDLHCRDISLPTHPFKPLQMRRMEYDILGFSPLVHPLEFFDGQPRGESPKPHRLNGLLAAMRHFKAGGTDLYFLTLDNPAGLHECTIPRKLLTQRLELGRAYSAAGQPTARFGVRTLRLRSLTPLPERT